MMLLLAAMVLYSIGKLILSYIIILEYIFVPCFLSCFLYIPTMEYAYVIGAVQSTATSLFQCRHSLDNIPVYTPNIPDFYFDSQNANSFSQGGSKSTLTTSENGYTYIFTLPSESSCSGTLTAVEYCYVTQRDIMQDIFILLLLTRGEGSSNFAVDNVLTVQDKPVNDICPSHGSKRYCCNTTIVTNGSHVSSLNNYAFGISTINDQTLPLRFDTDVAQYRVEHFKYNSPDSLFSKGQSFTPANLVNESLFLVRLFIGKHARECWACSCMCNSRLTDTCAVEGMRCELETFP